MQKDESPHIILIVADEFPKSEIDIYTNEIDSENLNLLVHKSSFNRIFASWDWAIPTLIAVHILKPYFDGFLKEVAKDHYGILKDWLKKVAVDLKQIKVSIITATESTKKKTDNQSKTFSIESRLSNGEKLKFLFDDNLDIQSWHIAIDKALKILEEHFTDGESDELTIEIKNNHLEKSIYARLKTDTIEWEFLDYKKIHQENQIK